MGELEKRGGRPPARKNALFVQEIVAGINGTRRLLAIEDFLTLAKRIKPLSPYDLEYLFGRGKQVLRFVADVPTAYDNAVLRLRKSLEEAMSE